MTEAKVSGQLGGRFNQVKFMQRDSFIFYKSFYEAISDIPSKDIKLEVLTALIEYALFGRLPEDLKPFAKGMFALIKPIIDKNNKRFENGKKGGRIKKSVETKTYDLTFEQEVQQMKDDKDFSESVCNEFNMTPEQYNSTLDKYLDFIRKYKRKPHDSLDDARSHFRFWAQKNNAPKNSKTDTPSDYSYKGGFGGKDS